MQVVTGTFHVTKDIAKILERGAQVLKSVLQMIFAYDHADIQLFGGGTQVKGWDSESNTVVPSQNEEWDAESRD